MSQERVSFWKEKFAESMNKQVSLQQNICTDKTIEEVKEEWLLEKLAVLMVGSEELGKRVKDLETTVDKQST